MTPAAKPRFMRAGSLQILRRSQLTIPLTRVRTHFRNEAKSRHGTMFEEQISSSAEEHPELQKDTNCSYVNATEMSNFISGVL